MYAGVPTSTAAPVIDAVTPRLLKTIVVRKTDEEHLFVLVPGDRVGIVCANNPSFVLAYLGSIGAGLVAVPLNPASPSAELRAELTAISAKVAFVGATGRDGQVGERGAGALDRVQVDAAAVE